MPDTHTQCPHCGFAYTVTPEQAAGMAGRSFACTNCGRPFALSPGGAAYAQPQQQVAYASGANVRSNPLAIASLICGCLLCVPLLGIAAIIMGALAMRKAKDPAVTGKGMAIAGLVLGILNVLGWLAYIGLIAAVMVPTMGVARQAANQAKCASNLQQIGTMIRIYAIANGGAYPDTLEQLVTQPGVTSAVFDCPVTGPVPPVTSSPQVLAGKIEYVYVGKGLMHPAGATTVVAYEPLANHGGAGANFLFGDGSTRFVQSPSADRMIEQVESGQNPPVGETGGKTPTTAPKQRAVEVER